LKVCFSGYALSSFLFSFFFLCYLVGLLFFFFSFFFFFLSLLLLSTPPSEYQIFMNIDSSTLPLPPAGPFCTSDGFFFFVFFFFSGESFFLSESVSFSTFPPNPRTFFVLRMLHVNSLFFFFMQSSALTTFPSPFSAPWNLFCLSAAGFLKPSRAHVLFPRFLSLLDEALAAQPMQTVSPRRRVRFSKRCLHSLYPPFFSSTIVLSPLPDRSSSSLFTGGHVVLD